MGTIHISNIDLLEKASKLLLYRGNLFKGLVSGNILMYIEVKIEEL